MYYVPNRLERIITVIINWAVLLTCPIWTPIAFVIYVFGTRNIRQNLISGEHPIWH